MQFNNQQMKTAFYNLSSSATLEELQVTNQGLTREEVQFRRNKYGSNIIPQPRSKSLFSIFLSQFLNPLIYILIVAAVISILSGDYSDAIFIAAIIIINALLGTYQEQRAENSAQALQKMVKVRSRVKRGGRIFEVDAEELVPGDIVLLESGHKVPADMRLLEVNELLVDEALLTGESLAAGKSITVLNADDNIAPGDRINMVFAATTVQKGRGVAVVTATAQHTEIGKIADSLRVTEPEKPPLEKRMEAFSKKISIIVLFICIVLGVIGYLEGMTARDVFFLMVAVGVSAIPEGLPVALTVALSIGTARMAKRNVIVRKLPAVEGLGSCTLIASDKTGTLTMDQQSVKRLYLPNGLTYDITGQGYNGDGDIRIEDEPITEQPKELTAFLTAVILANEAILRKTDSGWEHSGDAVDVALRALAYKAGKEPKYFQNQSEVIRMLPYESEKQYAAVFFKQHHNTTYFAMKGAVEVILEKLHPEEKEKTKQIAGQMAAEGYRVLAVAGATVTNTNGEIPDALHLLGLTGMIDPLRPEAKESVTVCRKAGVSVVMVTGDHPSTALAIAKNLGIAAQENDVITGKELSLIEESDISSFASRIENKKVFARVTPLQKQRIVEAMKSLGHFIAVTGDGANDAPALKSAHIGIAMGSGTDLAKEASSIIITDNNFASIAAGVEEGRFTFENLRKIIYLLISTGAAELLTVALAIILNTPLPFLPVQLLWLNLVTNGIQEITLAFEKGNPAVMLDPPRKPDESIFNKLMNSQIIISSLVMAIVVFGIWYYLIQQPGVNEQHIRSEILMLMVLIQNFHVLNCRSETLSLFRLPFKNNYALIAGIIAAQLVHISAAYIPGLNTTLQLEPVFLRDWLLLLPAAAIIFIVMEIFKLYWRKTHKL